VTEDDTRAEGAPYVVSIDVRPGTLFHGRYEILGLLGRGGMGMVYRAHDRRLDEVVAIKVLRPDFAADPKMAERFRSEIKLARKVRHRNVCTIHDYGDDRGLLYISMELIDGVDLKHLLKERGAFPREEAYEIAGQIALGLQAVHEAGIIHRDLKTPNIMLDRGGTARLMDFGIAKRVGEGTATATGQIVGTPEYMSPEQAQGHKVDHRSDLYALGVLIYEIFTGQVPFRGETPISTILKHLNDPPPLETTDLPEALRAVLRRCLAKEPAKRYQSSAEVAEALRQARSPSLRQQRVPTDVLQAPTRLMPATPRPGWMSRSLVLVVLGLGALALALGLGLWLWGTGATTPGAETREQARTPSPEVTERPTPPPPAPEAPASDALGTTETVSPAPVKPASPLTQRTPSPRPTPRPQMAAVSLPSPPALMAAAPPASQSTAPPTTTRPAEAPSAGPGLLQIAVKPWGEVSVDGRVIGQTPLDRMSLPAGSHRVRVRHPGFPLWEKDVVVKAGETTKVLVDLVAGQ
jgi:serine/threonine protein kinase